MDAVIKDVAVTMATVFGSISLTLLIVLVVNLRRNKSDEE